MDQLEAAIASANRPKPVRMTRLEVMISTTNRPAAIEIPADATDAELAELCGWMLTQVLGSLRAQRAQAPVSRIVVPT